MPDGGLYIDRRETFGKQKRVCPYQFKLAIWGNHCNHMFGQGIPGSETSLQQWAIMSFSAGCFWTPKNGLTSEHGLPMLSQGPLRKFHPIGTYVHVQTQNAGHTYTYVVHTFAWRISQKLWRLSCQHQDSYKSHSFHQESSHPSQRSSPSIYSSSSSPSW